MASQFVARWWRARWLAFAGTLDQERILAASNPLGTVGVVTILSAGLLALQYVPALHRAGGFEHAAAGVVLVLLGGGATAVVWRTRCRGWLGAVATLLDNVLYSSALVLAAVGSRDNVGLSVAAIHALSLVVFPGRAYPLTAVFGFAMNTPTALLMVLFRPQPAIALLLVGSGALLLVVGHVTANRIRESTHRLQLERALDAAGQMADQSMQTALTATLLSLGHFLHELRNHQTTISGNLFFLERSTQLDAEGRDALEEALQAQRAQQRLVEETISNLNSRAQPRPEALHLEKTLKEALDPAAGLKVRVECKPADLFVSANLECLKIVFLNLARNARQAGAGTLTVRARPDAGGRGVSVTVTDDGRGIPEDLEERLRASPSTADSGLGLYLIRRYTELIGGRVSIQRTTEGACFALHLMGASGP